MGWLGDGSQRGQGRQAWTAVGLPPRYPQLYRVFQKKIAQSLSTTVWQPCVTELCRSQQNVQKENVYTTKATVWIRQLNILCYSAGKWTIWKQSSRLGDTSRFAFPLAWHMIVLAVRRRLHGKNLNQLDVWVSSHQTTTTTTRQPLNTFGRINSSYKIIQSTPFPLSLWKFSSHSVNSPAFFNSHSCN